MKRISQLSLFAMKPPTEKHDYNKWQMRQQIARMHEKYGTAKNFLRVFKPELQAQAVNNLERVYTGAAPTLQCVTAGYSGEVALVWLCLQLESVNSFSGAREKLSVERQQELAELILNEYSYLKVSEILLFMYRLKCGHYGRFYGSVDPQLISSALLSFIQERRKDLERIRSENRQEQRTATETSSSRYISCEEYLRRKYEDNPQADSLLKRILNL